MQLAVSCAFLVPSVKAGELATLRDQKNQTPEQLIRIFADFKYELGDRVQDAETFLKRKRGDCDDFATLASSLLTQRGYNTKLVVVMMAGQTHVVCYVKEVKGILDFNHRADAQPVIESDGELDDIADKTAAYFRSPWHMASEIRYEKDRPVYVNNAFPRARKATPAAPTSPGNSEVAATAKTESPMPAEKAGNASPTQPAREPAATLN